MIRSPVVGFLLFVAAAWIIATLRAPVTGSAPPEPSVIVIDQRRFDYREDEGTGRRLADIRVVLERRGDASTLRIIASATGPHVDPIPGWQGVKGANRITAEELASIVEKGRMRVETDGTGLRETVVGTARLGRRGRIPERRRAAGGSIDLAAMTDTEYPLELIAVTPALGDGVRRTRLVVDGVPRLEITTSTGDGRSRILDVRAIHDFEATGRAP